MATYKTISHTNKQTSQNVSQFGKNSHSPAFLCVHTWEIIRNFCGLNYFFSFDRSLQKNLGLIYRLFYYWGATVYLKIITALVGLFMVDFKINRADEIFSQNYEVNHTVDFKVIRGWFRSHSQLTSKSSADDFEKKILIIRWR